MTATESAADSVQPHRGTVFVEDAEIMGVSTFPGEQFLTRLHAPQCASRAVAGNFVHVQCDQALPMRRPLSIMRAAPEAGWIEVLYKIVGKGLRALSARTVGERLSVIGPIGRGFAPSPDRRRALLIGGGVGMPPMVFLAETLRSNDQAWQPLALMGSEIPFPFDVQDSAIATDWLPREVIGTMPLLEQLQIPTRLASWSDYSGVYRGYVTDLAREWLDRQNQAALAQTAVFACGPRAMLQAVAVMAHEFKLPCQVSLEEFMACGIGGCAGCAVRVETAAGPAMKKVCVDGPVFDAATVFPVAGA